MLATSPERRGDREGTPASSKNRPLSMSFMPDVQFSKHDMELMRTSQNLLFRETRYGTVWTEFPVYQIKI